MIGTILVPLDGSVDAEGALPQVRRLVTETTGRVVLIRVVPTGPDLGDPPAEHPEAVAEAETYLQQVARGLASDGVPVQIEVFCVDPDDVEALPGERGSDLPGRTPLSRSWSPWQPFSTVPARRRWS